MGMFDSFFHRCPDCGNDVEWQSKAGDYTLRDYSAMDVPACIAGDLDGQTAQCRECGRTLTVHTTVIVTVA